MKKLEFQVIEAFPQGEPPPPYIWRCYTCGIGSDKGSFTNIWDYWHVECDVKCNTCGSTNTADDGEGIPECPKCGYHDWYCDKCCLNCCQECFEWFLVPFGEPEERICYKCSGFLENVFV